MPSTGVWARGFSMQSRKNPRHLYQRRELKPDEKPANLVLQFNPRPAVDMLVACPHPESNTADF
jgi:hypothetical protein